MGLHSPIPHRHRHVVLEGIQEKTRRHKAVGCVAKVKLRERPEDRRRKIRDMPCLPVFDEDNKAMQRVRLFHATQSKNPKCDVPAGKMVIDV